MDQDEFWNEIEQMKAKQGRNNGLADSPSAPSPTDRTIFSDDDVSFESITTLPTPLKYPRYSSNDTVDSDHSSSSRLGKPAKSQVSLEKFVPVNDVSKKRGNKDLRFNKIRPIAKQEQTEDVELAAWLGPPPILFEANAIVERQTSQKVSAMYKQSISEATDDEIMKTQHLTSAATSTGGGSKPKVACADCRSKHVRCTHVDNILQPKSGNPRKAKVENDEPKRKLRVKTEPEENRIKKEGAPRYRNPHDRSKGPSMTPNAIDYRERKVVQQQYQDRLAVLLDEDIVNQVEAEGGITPLGRIFKAVVRMLERVQLERAGLVKTMREPAVISSIENQAVDNRQMKRSESPLDAFKAKLQALIDAPQ